MKQGILDRDGYHSRHREIPQREKLEFDAQRQLVPGRISQLRARGLRQHVKPRSRRLRNAISEQRKKPEPPNLRRGGDGWAHQIKPDVANEHFAGQEERNGRNDDNENRDRQEES